MSPNFFDAFAALTGHEPFPWQRTLYEEWFAKGKFPSSCNLPTGLGKTNVVAIWLIALINHPGKLPRRLVYVVNRRTVVDQTTDEVERLRRNLSEKSELKPLRERLGSESLAISTLRGQFADNREWSADPSRPAVICGTVDMIGSRLLFSGYGVGFKAKPLHAGFLGQDVLLVHDEAHLEPAFQRLIETIRGEQGRCNEFGAFRVMELTATSRSGDQTFGLSDDDHEHPEVKKRINAKKRLGLHQSTDDKKLAEQLAALAVQHKDSGQAILVFAQKVEDVEKIASKLPNGAVERLTGTMRGLERDALVKKPVFQRFLPESNRDVNAEIAEGTVYLVCTSAGEVGVNLSADHLVCDLSTFESMAQRFGRVNRFGLRDDSRIDVVYPTSFGKGDKIDVLDQQRQATLALLQRLQGDASPAALEAKLTPAEKQAGFAPEPTILPVTDMLFDAWALTSIRGPMPGRPPVEPYLHGIAGWQPPETHVAWRQEVEVIDADELLERHPPADLLDVYPLKSHELLRDRSDRVFKHLEALAKRHGEKLAWVLDDSGSVEVTTLEKLADKRQKNRIDGCTILLPPSAGGLAGGMLDGTSHVADDVSDQWYADKNKEIQIRHRVWDDDFEIEAVAGMRLVEELNLTDPNDDDALPKLWRWFVRPRSADDDGSKTALAPVSLENHTDQVTNTVVQIAAALELAPELQEGLKLAAEFHDLGKRREIWQRSIGNSEPSTYYAKSGKDPATKKVWRPIDLCPDYRHEFGSLVDVHAEPACIQKVEELERRSPGMKDVVLHLVAAHHGSGRPHFSTNFDPAPNGQDTDALAVEVPRRFARLQRKYGRWGLAYLESLLRAADWAASAAPSAYADEPEVER